MRQQAVRLKELEAEAGLNRCMLSSKDNQIAALRLLLDQRQQQQQ